MEWESLKDLMATLSSAQYVREAEMTRGKLVRFIFEKSCLNKKSFSREAADSVVDRFAQRGELIFYYKCQFCNSYHLTSKSGKVEKRLEVV